MSEIRSQATPAYKAVANRRAATHALHHDLIDGGPKIDAKFSDIHHMAGNAIKAGWLKPRTVNSAAELDGLPAGSVVRELDDAPSVFEKVAYEEGETGWEMPGALHWYTPGEIALPATVLFTPRDAG